MNDSQKHAIRAGMDAANERGLDGLNPFTKGSIEHRFFAVARQTKTRCRDWSFERVAQVVIFKTGAQ